MKDDDGDDKEELRTKIRWCDFDRDGGDDDDKDYEPTYYDDDARV